MEVEFTYSINQEKARLVGLFSEYQWFLDQKFPVCMPVFFDELYKRNQKNKTKFIKEMGPVLEKNI